MRVFPGVSCITLGVEDVQRSTIFYEMLGWRVSRRASGPDASYFQLNNIVLALRSTAALAEVRPDEATPTMVLNQHYGSHRSVAKALYVAARARAPGVFGPSRTHDGGSSGGFVDLDGHAWSIAYDPACPPSPDGSLILPA